MLPFQELDVQQGTVADSGMKPTEMWLDIKREALDFVTKHAKENDVSTITETAKIDQYDEGDLGETYILSEEDLSEYLRNNKIGYRKNCTPEDYEYEWMMDYHFISWQDLLPEDHAYHSLPKNHISIYELMEHIGGYMNMTHGLGI